MAEEKETDSQSQTRYLIRQPLALQWFDNGKLVKRCEQERQAGTPLSTVSTRELNA
jgi:hypothetical protein